jgi:glycosyltransferase involved in cell wall biosynthesis
MTWPTVSVVTPFCNGARYLSDALATVAKQTRLPSEMILVDDGSTDGSADLVARFDAPFPKRLLQQPNGGQSAARNRAAMAATGKYLAFLDHDDIWHPRHIEILVGILEGDAGLGWAYSNIDEMDHDGRVVHLKLLRQLNPEVEHPKTSIYNMLKADMFIFPSAAVVRRDAFLAIGGFDDRLSGYEDDDLFLRMFRAGWGNSYTDDSLMRYRRHTASSAFSDRMWQSRDIYAAKLAAEFPDDPDLSRFFVRDVIAPRFFRTGVSEYLRHLARQHFDLCPKALAVAKQNFLKCRYPLRRRMRWHLILALMRYPLLFRHIYQLVRDDPRFA